MTVWITQNLNSFCDTAKGVYVVGVQYSHWSWGLKTLTFRLCRRVSEGLVSVKLPFSSLNDRAVAEEVPRESGRDTHTHSCDSPQKRKSQFNSNHPPWSQPVCNLPSRQWFYHLFSLTLSPLSLFCFESPPSSLQYQWNRDAFYSFADSSIVL